MPESWQYKVAANRHRRAQVIKYYVLLYLLAVSSGTIIKKALRGIESLPLALGMVAIVTLLVVATVRVTGLVKSTRGKALLGLAVGGAVMIAALVSLDAVLAASLQTGLLDPIPLLQRSMNLVLLPLLDAAGSALTPTPRYCADAWLIGAVLLVILLLLPKFPRFYCRFVCPLGALFGILGRYALWRVGKTEMECESWIH